MRTSELAIRHVFVVVCGLIFIAFLTACVGVFAPQLKLPVFIFLAICWLASTIVGLRETIANNDREPPVLREYHWSVEALPAEFRFITRDTTLQEVTRRLGQGNRVVRSDNIQAMQYDLSNGAAILVFPEPPFDSASTIRCVRLYRNLR
jgi:uncharacterized membrane protein YbaN (DUF454 family)